ncbi:hypothetical protein Q7C36_010903 [Tachysurus vachellii]|uniref:Uncharacterized protein n=1 Tax=Tachysurus vachellii TaxID=175792 RepID=A0AA88SUI2_TACVA|nr:hypothetical protein Q7C36_010903 [Tachysurus vachellii]
MSLQPKHANEEFMPRGFVAKGRPSYTSRRTYCIYKASTDLEHDLTKMWSLLTSDWKEQMLVNFKITNQGFPELKALTWVNEDF